MKRRIKVLITETNKEFASVMKKIIEKNDCYEVIQIVCNKDVEMQIIYIYRPDIIITNIRKENDCNVFDIIEKLKLLKMKNIYQRFLLFLAIFLIIWMK